MLKNILSNIYLNAASILAVPAAFLADVSGKPIAYAVAFIVVVGLIAYAYFDEKKKQKIYTASNIHLPIIFNVSNPANSAVALEALFKILSQRYPNHKENLEKYLNIMLDDLIFGYQGDIFDQERFVDFLKIVKHDIKQLQQKAANNTHLHIVYIGPVANAIAMGTILGTDGVTLYQYNKSTDSYAISLEIQDRSYKEHIEAFEIFDKETIGRIEKAEERVTVAIDLSSHKIALSKLQEPIVHLKSRHGATLKTSEAFIQANREIYAVINGLQQRVEKITLVYSMPTSVAMLLGMSIQNYWDIELTQFVEGEYKTVIDRLDRIKYYF